MADAQILSSDVASFEGARQRVINPKPVRLAGALAPGAQTPNTTVKVRVAVGGIATVRAIGKFSNHGAGGGNPTIAIYGLASDAGGDDTVGTRHTKGDPTPVAITGNGLFEIARDMLGEQYVEIEVTVPAASSLTRDWVDVLGI
jgi:hypothetical protein